jgi:hypothetical protein
MKEIGSVPIAVEHEDRHRIDDGDCHASLQVFDYRLSKAVVEG